MKSNVKVPGIVEGYISTFPAKTQAILKKLRTLVKRSVPLAVESMSYGMPAYKLGGKPLVYFAAYEKHIGLYATPQTHVAFKKELAKYKQGKGSVQFPLDEPVPFELIRSMVSFKAKLLEEITKTKKKK